LSAGTFALFELAPGDPAVAALQRGAIGLPPSEQVAEMRRSMGLDDPLPVRYARWLGDAVTGDFGASHQSGRPVRDILRDVVPPTLLLMGCALLLAWTLALLLGSIAGAAPGTWRARAIGGVTVALFASPSFVVALLGLYLFCARWQLLPTGGMTDAGERVSAGQLVRHLILPVGVLAVSYFGWYARVVEAAVAETRGAMFVQYARARGLPPGMLLRRHIMRASLVPFVAQAGASFAALIGGAYAVEVIFSWPGAGREAVRAATTRDYPVLMALVLLSGMFVLLGNLVADLIVARLDPRVRLPGLGAGSGHGAG